MSCFTPNLAFKKTFYDENGELKNLLFSFSKSTAEKRQLYLDNNYLDEFDIVEVPCGKCVGCRLDKSRDWAQRCVLETKTSTSAWFVTLTYDDDHLLLTDSGVPTVLSRKAFGGWIKCMREQIYRDSGLRGVRFFAVSEYGTEYHRPHYHVIFWNLPEVLFRPYPWSSSPTGRIYRSTYMESLWDNGFVAFAPVNFRTAAYTARYCMKKQYGLDKQLYGDRVPEWSSSSSRPGIGYNWFLANIDFLKRFDSVPLKVGDSVINMRPCKYFDKKMKERDPDALANAKAIRQVLARQNMESKLSQTDKNLDELRMIELVAKIESIKSLKRNFES